jgi:hypothetical protein
MIENQNRQYGGVNFDNMYQQPHGQPQFTDPWAGSHTSSHANPPVYATSMGGNQMGLNAVKHDDVNRPTAISLPYSSIPVSAPSLVAASNYTTAGYGGQDMLGMQHEMPRSTFEQAPTYTTAAPMGGFTPANYAPLNYASSLHHPQDARKFSHA